MTTDEAIERVIGILCRNLGEDKYTITGKRKSAKEIVDLLLPCAKDKPGLVALDESKFPLAQIQRITGVGLHRAIEVRELICNTFGRTPEVSVESIMKEFTESITNGIPYLIFDTSPEGIKLWIKSMQDSFRERLKEGKT